MALSKKQNEEVYILSLDAKDIYIANNYIESNSNGYNIRNKKGDINTKKFINTLDYSLELIELREVDRSIHRNSNFSFFSEEKEYVKKVINVTFKYSNKEFNNIYKNTYVRFGYNLNTHDFIDGVCIQDGLLVGIKIDKPIKESCDDIYLQEGYFKYEDGKYILDKKIPTLNTISELREEIYKNGFYCDGVKYIRFKRSGGSSRVGKCLFIEERLYKKMFNWSQCGLTIKEGQEIDLASFESGIALTLSSIIDTVEIKPENILVIDDYKSCFKDDVVAVYMDNNRLKTKTDNIDIQNIIWDGQSLMDSVLFGNYSRYGMLLLRNRFFKSCCFNTNIQTFFKDNNITDISQLNGFTLATDIKDIKLITTPSSIKYLKFASLEQWFENLDTIFGIVKHEKPTYYFDGRMVQVHYQLLNTLQLTKDNVRDLVKPNLDYINLIDNNPSVLRYHIQYPDDIMLNLTSLLSKNDIVYNMLGINERFTKTKLYYEFKRDLLRSMIKNLKKGHLLVKGNYSTLLGNPYEMLLSSIGKFNGKSEIGVGNIHSLNFDEGEEIVGSRSPHITFSNVWLIKNKLNNNILRYFNLTNEIVCINSIKENTLERLSGADMDSDTCLLSNNKILVSLAKKNYHKFRIATSQVCARKVKRSYTKEQQCDLDIKTSTNAIGEIINFSQELNSLFWDSVAHLTPEQHNVYETNKWCDIYIDKIKVTLGELYEDICILNVMSCIEIDKAKKEFDIDNLLELKELKEKYKIITDDDKTIKPYFFGVLAKMKGYYSTKKKKYKTYCTAMDYLQKEINRFKINKPPQSFEDFSSILKFDDYSSRCVKYDQINRIIKIINETKKEVGKIWNSDDKIDSYEKYKMASEARQKCVDVINAMKINTHTMYNLLLKIETEQCKNIRRLMFSILFGAPNKDFFKLIENSKSTVSIAEEKADGDTKIHNFNFKI